MILADQRNFTSGPTTDMGSDSCNCWSERLQWFRLPCLPIKWTLHPIDEVRNYVWERPSTAQAHSNLDVEVFCSLDRFFCHLSSHLDNSSRLTRDRTLKLDKKLHQYNEIKGRRDFKETKKYSLYKFGRWFCRLQAMDTQVLGLGLPSYSI